MEGVAHDTIRRGTTTLFEALDVGTSAEIAECKTRHRHQEFVSFLRTIHKGVPDELVLHLIVDYYCTPNHALNCLGTIKLAKGVTRDNHSSVLPRPTASAISSRWRGIANALAAGSS